MQRMCLSLRQGASGGIFYLRIEDTDKKREIEDGVTEIIKGLEAFDIVPDEGVVGFGREKGDYGPYTQSARREIYRDVCKEPCGKRACVPVLLHVRGALRTEGKARGAQGVHGLLWTMGEAPRHYSGRGQGADRGR